MTRYNYCLEKFQYVNSTPPTFNSSKELQPASENVSRAGGMFKVNRNMDSNVDILNGGYIPIEQPKLPEAVLPDFGIKIKPFTVGI